MRLRRRLVLGHLADLYRLALPVVVSRAGVLAMTVADTIIVGRYSSAELGYLSLGVAVYLPLLLTVMGLLTGTTVAAAQAMGRGDPAESGASWRRAVPVALAFGAVNTATRFLAGAENPNAIVFYMYGLMCLYASVPTILAWETPSWADVPWLAATGLFAAIAQQGITRSLSMAPTAIAMPAYYLQLPFAAVAGYFLFGEAPDAWIWLGAAVICGATYYVIRTAPPERR